MHIPYLVMFIYEMSMSTAPLLLFPYYYEWSCLLTYLFKITVRLLLKLFEVVFQHALYQSFADTTSKLYPVLFLVLGWQLCKNIKCFWRKLFTTGKTQVLLEPYLTILQKWWVVISDYLFFIALCRLLIIL